MFLAVKFRGAPGSLKATQYIIEGYRRLLFPLFYINTNEIFRAKTSYHHM